MALLKTLPDPFGGPDLENCYLRWADLVISPRTRTIRVVFEAFRNEAARNAGRAPLPIPVEFTIGPVGVPAVLAEDGTIVSPAIPSYDEFRDSMSGIVDGQPGAADLIGALVYGYAKTQPRLADAEDI